MINSIETVVVVVVVSMLMFCYLLTLRC